MAADAGPESVKVARDFTGETLQAWGLRALATDAAVVVSELVTNALRYGCPGDGERLTGRTPVERLTGRTELVLWGRTSQLICVVIDSSPLPPAPAPAGFAAEYGRGLRVVDALASRWGWTLLGIRRKAVWAAIHDVPEQAASRRAPTVTGLSG